MAASTKKDPNSKSELHSTQNSLLISEIKDGVVVLKDGTMRAVILASAINFDLMSRQEQDGVEYSYQSFLNSLHFPIQIVVRSQKIDLDRYLEKLSELKAGQDNDLLALLMEDYIANIKSLLDEVNIMDKQFYVVVPFYPPIITKTSFFDSLKTTLAGQRVITVTEADFNQYKTELTQRVALVASGLNQMGIRAIPLNSQELIDLYYSTYNPDVAANQKLIDPAQLQTPIVTRAAGPMPGPSGLAVHASTADITISPTPSPAYTAPIPQSAQPTPVQYVPVTQPAPAPPITNYAPDPLPQAEVVPSFDPYVPAPAPAYAQPAPVPAQVPAPAQAQTQPAAAPVYVTNPLANPSAAAIPAIPAANWDTIYQLPATPPPVPQDNPGTPQ